MVPVKLPCGACKAMCVKQQVGHLSLAVASSSSSVAGSDSSSIQAASVCVQEQL